MERRNPAKAALIIPDGGTPENDRVTVRKTDGKEKALTLPPLEFYGRSGTLNAFAHAIHKAGYATDPLYASKLIDLMKTWDLYRFDRGGPKTNGKHHPKKDEPK